MLRRVISLPELSTNTQSTLVLPDFKPRTRVRLLLGWSKVMAFGSLATQRTADPAAAWRTSTSKSITPDLSLDDGLNARFSAVLVDALNDNEPLLSVSFAPTFASGRACTCKVSPDGRFTETLAPCSAAVRVTSLTSSVVIGLACSLEPAPINPLMAFLVNA